ncbi:hypothetical protein DL96DRAFT_1703002 [Flagelloscypha sp. PMI_526]|nr:hypothetical protein DL96DRAFT_1703002 [Flagelloscypha sp. PMI_526]
MGKKSKRSAVPDEEHLILPARVPAGDELVKIIDTHTHLLSTFTTYRSKYPDGRFTDIFDFVRGVYKDQGVESIVDVWCEAPVTPTWKELADSALAADAQTNWGGVQYWFVIGVHPHNAKDYTDEVENQLLAAAAHPRNVGWGEMGLDYHYDNSPRDIQQEVFARQLRHAVRLNKALTIHTREADDDTERILKEIVPKDWKIHIHCFTDNPEFGQRLLDWFPNLYIGLTGVITFATNLNTAALVRSMKSSEHPRFLLETDAPFMTPSNIYNSLSKTMKGRLPLSHSAMIPHTASFIADILNGTDQAPSEVVETTETSTVVDWTADRVLAVGRENARRVYGLEATE